MKKKTIILAACIFLLYAATQPLAGGMYKQKLDNLEMKFSAAMKKGAINVRDNQLTALIASGEALAICAQLYQTQETRDILTKRIDQFHSTVSKAKNFEDKMLQTSVGIYNFITMIANARCANTPYMQAVRDIDKKTARVGKNDSLDTVTKTAIILSGAFKMSSVFTITADTLGKNREDLQKLVKEFDEKAKQAPAAIDGIAISGEQTVKMFVMYARLLYPRLRKELESYLRDVDSVVKTSDERVVTAYWALFKTVVLLSRRLDLR